MQMSIWLLRVVIPALNSESVLDNVLHQKKKLHYLTMIVNFVIVNISTEWIFELFLEKLSSQRMMISTLSEQ